MSKNIKRIYILPRGKFDPLPLPEFLTINYEIRKAIKELGNIGNYQLIIKSLYNV